MPPTLRDLEDSLESMRDDLESMASTLSKGLRNNLSDALSDLNNMAEALREGKDITKDLATKTAQYQKQSSKLALDQIDLEAQLLEAVRNRNYASQQKIEKQLIENQNAQYQIEKQLEAARLLSQLAQEEKKVTEEKKKQNNLLDFAKEKYGKLLEKLKDFFSITSIFKLIVDGANEFNKAAVQISKNFGYSAMGADRLAFQLKGIGLLSNATNVNFKNLVEAQNQLSTATGFVAEYSADALTTQIMLTKQLGLSGEEAAGIYKLSVLTGKSSEKVNDEMVGAFVAARNSYKAGVPFQATMAAAAKVSGQLKANLQANPAGIVKAVVATTALGTSLEQTAAQGEKLLDFSSSIESELKAELLTGKQLNLERARAAALAGDQVALAEELNKNIGTYEDFTKMNVLQQKALAESVGLTTDQLANQLEKQKLARESGKSLAEITKEEALKAEKRKNTEQKFSDIMDKLKDIIGAIGAAFSPIIEGITFILDHSIVLYSILGVALLAKLPGLIKGFKDIRESIKDAALNAKSLFTKGPSAVGGVADKAKETAEKAAESGEKAGVGGGGAGEGIKSTLEGISAGIKSFREVKLSDLLKVGGAALALTALTPAVPALLLLQFVKGDLIEKALTGIGNGLAAIGDSLKSPQLLLGLIAFTGVMVGLGYALNLAAPAIKAVGEAVGTVITSIATGISTIVGAIGDMIVKLGEVGPSLLLLGPALFGIAGGLASMGFAGILATPVIMALTALGAVAPALTKLGIGGGEKGEEGNPDQPLIDAINEVKAAITELQNRPVVISMDGKQVGSNLAQSSYKLA